MRAVAEPRDIVVPTCSTDRLVRLVGPKRASRLLAAAEGARRSLDGRRVWNLSSTATGGGVAEMLHLLVGYANDMGIDGRWVVIEADADFFAVTKRLHNRLHGTSGDDGDLGPPEATIYRSTLEANATALDRRVEPGDIVILHDPQTAGLADHLVSRGAHVVWRCHIGTDQSNAFTREAWDFLLPHLAECHAYVFSRAAFVPSQLGEANVRIIKPSIDPLSPKNRYLPRDRVTHLLTGIGLMPGERFAPRTSVLGGAGPISPGDRVVLQVSRWDHLKDMLGVLHGFSEHVAGRTDAKLALVGPSVEGVADDPEGAQVLAECLDGWAELPQRVRDSVRLVALPTEDLVANALMVNATQRYASVVVQKSLQEGFGLTVTEAMWKSRPVVASAVGGIVDQVPPGTGVLLEDPGDLDVFGRTLNTLLAQPEELSRLGRRARLHVREHFLSDRHLIDYASLLESISRE